MYSIGNLVKTANPQANPAKLPATGTTCPTRHIPIRIEV